MVYAEHGPKLLKISDVCRRLQMGKTKVYEFIATGELDSLKLDGARRVTETQLADFIAKRAAASNAPARAAAATA